MLKAMTADPLHVYLASLQPPVDGIAFETILGSKQVTDLYLLGLARRHKAVLLSFDARLRLLAGAQTKIRILRA